jgi:hypothetical protein
LSHDNNNDNIDDGDNDKPPILLPSGDCSSHYDSHHSTTSKETDAMSFEPRGIEQSVLVEYY